ncbi:phosphoglucosamine mutase [Nocardioides dongkuii]|uniref:phosphoglucosamine mutase n=1 Tax=Nocardioides dongkuii TaxID=2760089 RepID=UPI0015FD8A5E|nr:phosphoglucosamine mutase [Nocardioides dongkuii]
MGRLFGTDGVRGQANGLLTASLALDLSVAAARVLVDRGGYAGQRPRAVVGRDTRISGQFLEHAVVAGLASAGVDVVRVRVVPTPGVAFLTDALGADVGVVISASHNPMPDNGIKFLARGGVKLDDTIERAIEERMGQPWQPPTGADVGRVTPYSTPLEEYVAHLVSTVKPLTGLRVVLDCAHGAAYQAGPMALAAAGATVIPINAAPDGLNINEGCGSTHLGPLQAAVLEHGADAGFALDGDADRCLAVDHRGRVVDGDQIMAILALGLRDAGRLRDDTLVVTVMSNLGLLRAMAEHGVAVRQTAVGDRYVLETMNADGYSLGGEQSGHVIQRDHATTGDGILTALHVLERMVVTGESLASLASVMTRFPQVLVNVGGVDRSRTDDEVLAAAVAEEEAALGDTGRVLLRPSGTEPLVRVMVEAETQGRAEQVAERLAKVVRERLTLS